MKIEFDFYPISIDKRGEERQVPEDRFSAEEIKEMIHNLVDARLEELADSREGFTFITYREEV